jgi:hypothetical protein
VTKKLRRLFPRLFGGEYRLASKKTKKYNCIAWAAGHNDLWWESSPDGYWPPNIPNDGSVEAAIRLYEHLGYRCTDINDRSPEEGVEKVAIYGDDQGYTHAARQRQGGGWTSKLGKLQDIEHDTLESLTGSDYGAVVQIMRRGTIDPHRGAPATV